MVVNTTESPLSKFSQCKCDYQYVRDEKVEQCYPLSDCINYENCKDTFIETDDDKSCQEPIYFYYSTTANNYDKCLTSIFNNYYTRTQYISPTSNLKNRTNTEYVIQYNDESKKCDFYDNALSKKNTSGSCTKSILKSGRPFVSNDEITI